MDSTQTPKSRPVPFEGDAGMESASPVNDRVILYITRPQETKNCNFWIGFYKHGPNMPNKLYDLESIDDVYGNIASEGLHDKEPILISNTEKSPPEYFYLLPLEDILNSPVQMIALIYDTLTAISPKRVGLYFSPDLVSKKECLSLVKRVLLSCEQAYTREFYLYAGEHGVNSVLNTAIEVKQLLKDRIEVLVFH